jgi:hypothetical protein
VFCVACSRRAAPLATIAGLSAAGSERSKLGDWPTPATPASDFVRAIRAGEALGSPCPVAVAASEGVSTFVGDATASAALAERRGEAFGAAEGLTVGTLASEAF